VVLGADCADTCVVVLSAGCVVSCVQEHCLVGIRGKLLRGRDHAFVHANCDTDIIFSEEPELGSTEKPDELYDIIERFCNGRWVLPVQSQAVTASHCSAWGPRRGGGAWGGGWDRRLQEGDGLRQGNV
jgi:N6-adenosine-specific RNA methylase IME4